MSDKQPPLNGLRVLDLGQHAATALASMVLADFGAEVTAVAPQEGLVATHPAAPMLLRGKRVLDQAQGTDVERALVAADVVLTTLGPDDAAPAINERQIHLNISGWGMQGPYARYPMREGLVAARSGRMLEFQMQNGRMGPVYAAVQVATLAASQLGVQGILAALLARDSTGRGQRVETSLLQGLIPYDVLHLTRAHLETRFPEALPPQPGMTRPPILGYQPVQGKDGRWLQLGNIFDHLFLHYLELTGLTDVPPVAERGKPNQSWTPEAQDIVRIAMLKKMRERPAVEWMALFNSSGNVAAAPFQTTQEALDDPDMVIPGDVVDCTHPTLGDMRWLGPIAHFQETPARIRVGHHAASATTRASIPATPKSSSTSTSTSKDTPLKGVTVLEFASVVATPLAMAGLSELGARIIKVEPIGGDPGRWLNGMMSQHIIPVKPNAGKESICIELKSPKGREILDRLLPKADLIAHNFRPGVPEKLGFGYERARSFNPKVVWVSANGYHPSAPGADRPCAHPIPGAQCGGVLHQVGTPLAATDDIDALIKGAFSLYRANDVNPDPNTSMIAGSAALLGLHAARQLGIGQQINVDMMQASLYANFDDALRYAGKPPRPGVDADLRGLHALARLYECRKGWIYIELASDDEFRQLCAALQLNASDARFAGAAARHSNDAALVEQLATAFRRDDATAWESRLAHLGCVQADAAETGHFWHDDPHVAANGLVLLRDHPRYGPYLRHGPLVTFSQSAVDCGPASLAGDHTDRLLQELGYSAADIAQLRADKVVWSEDSSRLPY